jgi:hypothetical protein
VACGRQPSCIPCEASQRVMMAQSQWARNARERALKFVAVPGRTAGASGRNLPADLASEEKENCSPGRAWCVPSFQPPATPPTTRRDYSVPLQREGGHVDCLLPAPVGSGRYRCPNGPPGTDPARIRFGLIRIGPGQARPVDASGRIGLAHVPKDSTNPARIGKNRAGPAR